MIYLKKVERYFESCMIFCELNKYHFGMPYLIVLVIVGSGRRGFISLVYRHMLCHFETLE